MLLIHLPTNFGSVECTSCYFFLLLFRNYVYHHVIFQKINKGGWNKSGGVGKFFKINKRLDDFQYWRVSASSQSVGRTLPRQTKFPYLFVDANFILDTHMPK